VQFFSPAPHDGHEIRAFEYVEMFGDGLARHGHAFAKLSERLAVVGAQPVEKFAARAIGEGFEHVEHLEIIGN
jgi:hypothetical protein